MLKLVSAYKPDDEPDDEARFVALYGAHFVGVRRYAVRLAGDVGHGEDIAQEVFVRLWKEIRASGEPPNTRAWVFRVATNLGVNRFRSRARDLRIFRPASASEAAPAAAAVDLERESAQREMVARVLAHLPDPMRQCLLLHHEGLTGREMGEVLGVKPSYVSTLVFRAHERFRRECDALGGCDGLFG